MATILGTQIMPQRTTALDQILGGLSQGLQNRWKQQQTYQGLSSLLGNDQARQISMLPQYLQFSLLNRLGGKMGRQGGKLDESMAKQIFEMAGGDKDLARKMAQLLGF